MGTVLDNLTLWFVANIQPILDEWVNRQYRFNGKPVTLGFNSSNSSFIINSIGKTGTTNRFFIPAIEIFSLISKNDSLMNFFSEKTTEESDTIHAILVNSLCDQVYLWWINSPVYTQETMRPMTDIFAATEKQKRFASTIASSLNLQATIGKMPELKSEYSYFIDKYSPQFYSISKKKQRL